MFLFVFWKKLKTPKRHFEIIWPLLAVHGVKGRKKQLMAETATKNALEAFGNSLGHREMGMKYRSSVLWVYNSKNNNLDVPPTQNQNSVKGDCLRKFTSWRLTFPRAILFKLKKQLIKLDQLYLTEIFIICFIIYFSSICWKPGSSTRPISNYLDLG